jgi:hypothetical protein
MLFLGIRNAVSERSVPLCSYKCLIVLDTSFMGEDRSCMVLCRNIYCVCMYCIMYLTVSTISRQMCAVSGPAQTEKSSSKENISGQMVHCANDVCWGDRLFIMSGSQGLFTSLQAGRKGDLGMICISARGSKATYQDNSPPRSLKKSVKSVQKIINCLKSYCRGNYIHTIVLMPLSQTCFFDMSMKNFRIQLEKCSPQSSFSRLCRKSPSSKCNLKRYVFGKMSDI